MIELDVTDRKLLGLLQAGFPLTAEPYTDLGRRLGVGGDEVMRRIQSLKTRGIVRLIGPVLDARRLGYQSTLVAMKVAADHLARAARIIREHPGVSHGYQRGHDFNVWLTLSVPGEVNIGSELEKLAAAAGAEAAFALPALKVFKLRAYFGADGEGIETVGMAGPLPQKAELSGTDRLIINGLQLDLALVARPFSPTASSLDMAEADLLKGCQSLLHRGIIRRFGAQVSHRKAGYRANAMACWPVSNGKVDAAGQRLASLREVSHCYERQTGPLWRYNLFAMVHGRIRGDCEKVIAGVSNGTGLSDGVTLFSTREFKKIRVKYSV